MDRECIYDVIKSKFIAIGVGAPPQSRRKSAVTLMVGAHIPIERGAEQLGHSSIETTRRHYLAAESLAYPTEDVLYYLIMRLEKDL